MTRRGVVVLGAGPAGLAFAHGYGEGAVVLEKTSEVGGLCRSIEMLDGVFDIGGHSFHTPHQEVHTLVRDLMGASWHQQPRDARVWFSGELIPYPFQHHYEKITDAIVVEACRRHVADAKNVGASKNFENWIERRFGPGISSHFMIPYNRKLWAHGLREMSCDWVGQRVATDRGASTSAGSERRPLQSDSPVAYPTDGGFGTIFKALAQRCGGIEFNQDICCIDLGSQIVYSRSGRSWPWREIVSTMPLPKLLECLSSCPNRLRQLATELQAVSLKILMLLIKPPISPLPQRVYIADHSIPPHKVAFNHTSSPNLARRTNHAVMCEVSYSQTKPAPPDEELIDATANWLLDAGFVAGRENMVASQVVDVPLGYPINTHGKAAIVEEIREYLKGYGIHTIGRFGAWDYANSDECIRQGLDLARCLAGRGATKTS